MKKSYIVLPLAFLLFVAGLWQLAATMGWFPPMLFPTLPEIGRALVEGFRSEQLGESALYTMVLIGKGIGLGAAGALVLSGFSALSRHFRHVFNLVIAVCDPLPGIALLPVAIMWFGTGEGAILFTIVHSVLWPLSRSLIQGFLSVNPAYTEVGQNLGLSPARLMFDVQLPSSFPHLLSGFKTSWGRAWRAVISAEMIFGAGSAIGGVGWYIFRQRYMMNMAGVFATLLVIVVIGILVEFGLFALIERMTVDRWGMVRE